MTKDEELKEAGEWFNIYLDVNGEEPTFDQTVAALIAYHHHRLEVERQKMKKKTIENLIG